MKTLLRRGAAGLFLLYDSAYQKLRCLQSVDDLLFVNRGVYKGPERSFADGTRLSPGDSIGVIHFNNRYLSRVQALSGNSGSSKRAAFAFGSALIKSMHKLAPYLSRSPKMSDLRVIGGVTWFKAHGRQIGFEIEALPPGPRQRFLRAHFRLMLSLLFPHLAARENHRLEPHQFWITRNQLEKMAVSDSIYTAKRLVKYDREII